MTTDPVYNRIGKDYDLSRRADPHIADLIFGEIAQPKGAKVLDLGCGSGNYSVALQERGLNVTAVDISAEMLDKARKKSQDVNWVQADARQALPFEEGEFLGAFSVLATHHIQDLPHCFSEVARVLDNGQLVIFTCTPEQMDRYWEKEYWPTAIAEASARMESYESLEKMLLEAGFRTVQAQKYFCTKEVEDRFLRAPKHHPELYLRPEVRAGISTFTLASDQDEIEKGCDRLARDLESRHFDTVVQNYESDEGDMLFVIGTC